jgi:preprotein translocase subunit Sec63
MAKRKIIWSKIASNKLSEILEFYNQRNLNKKSSPSTIYRLKNFFETLSWINYSGLYNFL